VGDVSVETPAGDEHLSRLLEWAGGLPPDDPARAILRTGADG
jgi:hypothetical protein